MLFSKDNAADFINSIYIKVVVNASVKINNPLMAERIPCEPTIDCPEWPRCYLIDLDGIHICNAIWKELVSQIDVETTDYELFERPES